MCFLPLKLINFFSHISQTLICAHPSFGNVVEMLILIGGIEVGHSVVFPAGFQGMSVLLIDGSRFE